jgi:glyceraldehyde-3-phosphate dehydrogenase (NAD(P))
MGTSKVHIAVNGYDAAGRCIADAIAAQEDMELVGVADRGNATRAKAAVVKGYPVFGFSYPTSGVPIAGLFMDLLRQADVVVDITPHPSHLADSSILEGYRTAGVKVVFQSDADDSLAGHSFVAQANYDTAFGRDRTRVVSSASTAIVRTLGALKNAGLLKRARGTLFGHATALCTPNRENDIPVTVFSSEGWDAEQILCDTDVVTTSLGATRSVCQLHTWNVELTCPTVMEEILAIFRHTPRVTLLSAADRVGDLNRPYQPCDRTWDVSLWLDSMAISGRDLFYTYEVYNPAAIVAETVDAIRALAGSEKDATASIAKTDRALGQVHELVPHSDWVI